MNRKETLQLAMDAVDRRPKSYGPPEQNFDRIARRWSAHLMNRYGDDVLLGNELTTTDVAIMCADLKLARLEETPTHEDSWVDLAGYAACGAEVSTQNTVGISHAGQFIPFDVGVGVPHVPEPGGYKPEVYDVPEAGLPQFPYDEAVEDTGDGFDPNVPSVPPVDQSANGWWRNPNFGAAAQATVEKRDSIKVGDRVVPYWALLGEGSVVTGLASPTSVYIECSCGDAHEVDISDLVKVRK